MATTKKLIQAAAGVSEGSGSGSGGGSGGGSGSSTLDISGVSYASKSYDVSSEATFPCFIDFNTDGTKMIIGDFSTRTFFTYSLSTAWDASTASYDGSSSSFVVGDTSIYPLVSCFGDDGKKLYVGDHNNAKLHQHTLSTAYDVSTASSDSKSLHVFSVNEMLRGPAFSSDGTKLYVAGPKYEFSALGQRPKINQWDLTTAWDISTASFANKSLSIVNEIYDYTGGSNAYDVGSIHFNSSGTQVFLQDAAGNALYQYDLTTAWDISTASYANKTFDLSNETSYSRGLAFDPDATKMYTVGNINDTVYQYDTNGTWTLSSGGGGGGGGSTGGLNIEDVYSISRYTGTSATQSVTNGVDLSTHGGVVLTARTDVTDSAARSLWTDTTRGGDKQFDLGSSGSEATFNISSFNTDGYTLSSGNYLQGNYTGYEYYSQTFRDADDFFTHGQYTGNGTSQTITHGLNGTVGMIWIKTSGNHWVFWHRGFTGTNSWNYLNLAYASGSSNSVFGNNTTYVDPTTTEFTVGSDGKVNGNGDTYTYYVWAHNDGSTHGDDSSQDMIKCGTYTGNGDQWDGALIDLGFRPQSVWITPKGYGDKRYMINALTGMPNEYAYNQYNPAWFTDSYGGQVTNSMWVKSENTGFQLRNNQLNYNNYEYIYMAIRRENMGKPTDVTKVFKVDNVGESTPLPYYKSGFTTDMVLTKSVQSYVTDWLLSTRDWPTKAVKTNSNAIGGSGPIAFTGWDNNEGAGTATLNTTNNPGVAYLWKTARSFFDHHMYMGKGTGARTLNHDLQTIPEMVWLKRDTANHEWYVYHKDAHATSPEDYHLILNTDAAVASSTIWDGTAPTATTIRVATSLNTNWGNYMMYCFGTADGVSKVGGISHTTGSNTVVDCGFASGSSLVMLKRTDAAGNWLTYDATRGIVSGNDSRLSLNSNAQVVTNVDEIDPNSSGFEIGASLPSGDYIYYALA